MTVLIYTPTYADGPHPETLRSVSQQTYTDYVHEVSWHNPYPGRNMANVVAQYQRAQEMILAGEYEALLTVEHDMILPPDALEKLMATDAPVVYGVYMLRHGTATLNAWQKIGNRNIGMSLSLYPKEVEKAKKAGAWEVSGTGWGCTLIRRKVLERLTVHSNSETDAGDITFSTDCLRAGIKMLARFDVECGHIEPNGNVLYPFGPKGVAVVGRVIAMVDVTVNVNGQSLAMKRGRYYTLPLEVAHEASRAGYVRITNDETVETADATPEREVATPKRTRKAKNAIS